MVAMGGGVQYAFLRDGGMQIFKDASKAGAEYLLAHSKEMIGSKDMVPEGSAHITGAGKLQAKQVIHAVSVGREGCTPRIISLATKNSLLLAKEKKLESIGFPTFGTGLYGVSMEDSVGAMSEEFAKHLRGDTTVGRIGIILYGPEAYESARAILDRKFRGSA